MSLIVYADFSSPECYVASRRADALAGVVEVDWRAVESRADLPVGGVPLSGEDRRALVARFSTLQASLLDWELLPWRIPAVVPKTEAAVSAWSELCGSRVAGEARRLLFELYWREGADIGNPNVLRTPLTGPVLRSGVDADPLREAGYAVAVNRGPITGGAYRRVRAWRAEWLALDRPDLPVLLVDGATLTGLDAVRRLGKELVYRNVRIEPPVGDPRRYPRVDGRPPESWVSQIGGRWGNLYRLPDARALRSDA